MLNQGFNRLVSLLTTAAAAEDFRPPILLLPLLMTSITDLQPWGLTASGTAALLLLPLPLPLQPLLLLLTTSSNPPGLLLASWKPNAEPLAATRAPGAALFCCIGASELLHAIGRVGCPAPLDSTEMAPPTG
jgi:hypothetical protein